MKVMYRPTLYSSRSLCASTVCAALNAWIFSPDRGFNAKFLLYRVNGRQKSTKIQKGKKNHTRSSTCIVFFAVLCVGARGSDPLVPKRVGDILLLEVVPYYLKWLDGVSVLFPVSHGENSEHRGFVQY